MRRKNGRGMPSKRSNCTTKLLLGSMYALANHEYSQFISIVFFSGVIYLLARALPLEFLLTIPLVRLGVDVDGQFFLPGHYIRCIG